MIILHSGCKINLGLRLLNRLANGFHSLESIFYPLPYPRDTIKISPLTKPELNLICPGLDPQENILTKTWQLFAEATGIKPGLRIQLTKRVPLGAGLGGGSANAAVFLNWLNRTANKPLTAAELTSLATILGADVPFFLENRPCLVTGIGEKLLPIALNCQGCWLLLIYPGFPSNTAKAFAAWDKANIQEPLQAENTTATIRSSLENTPRPLDYLLTKGMNSHISRFPGVERNAACELASLDLVNDLEAVIVAKFPCLRRLRAALRSLGASVVTMSGSGSSFCGLFPSRSGCEAAGRRLRRDWSRVYCLPMRTFGV